MSHPDEGLEGMLERVRETYHVPPETPRDAMWDAISARLDEDRVGPGDVVDLSEVRRARSLARSPVGWAAAAAALVVIGVGIGRATAPTVEGVPAVATTASTGAALRLASADHLGRTESLLTMVRADGRSGAIDPATAAWARGLLSETRMLLDAGRDGDPEVSELLEDLELVLVQIVGVAEMRSDDGERTKTELDLALRSLEDGRLLPRIQAVVPVSMAGA